MLGLVPLAAPLRVVEVLPPPGGVGAHRLQVTVRTSADPDLLPGGRDDQSYAPFTVLGRESDTELVEVFLKNVPDSVLALSCPVEFKNPIICASISSIRN